MPDPVYRAVIEHCKLRRKPLHRRSPVIEIEVTARRVAGPSVRDVATGRSVEISLDIDEQRA